MDILPTLRQLDYLKALRDHGSFIAASRVAGVTQSTLSAAIADLEDLFGAKVAERTGRRVVMTPFGLEMAAQGEDILGRAAAMMERARSLNAPMSGMLRLGVIPTIAPYLLPDILPRIHQAYPALELSIREDFSARLAGMARDGELDLILMAFPFDTPGLTQMILFEEYFYIACPAGWEPPDPAAIDPDSILLLDDGHCLRDHALEACALQGRARKSAFSASSLPTLIQMVAHGYGITFLPEMATDPRGLPDGVAVVPFPYPRPTRRIGLAWRRGSPRKDDFAALGRLIAQR